MYSYLKCFWRREIVKVNIQHRLHEGQLKNDAKPDGATKKATWNLCVHRAPCGTSVKYKG